MGSLKTLTQIIQYLSHKDSSHVPDKEPLTKATDQSLSVNDNNITAVLLETVSELTGYPQDMLGLDMDIESD